MFWIVFYFIPIIDPKRIHHPDKAPIHIFEIKFLVNHLLFLALFYTNALFLMPKFLKRPTKNLYFISIFLLFIFILFLGNFLSSFFDAKPFVDHVNPEHSPVPILRFFILVLPLTFILSLSVAYRLIIDKIQNEKRNKEKENEQLKTELLFLRSQISPHFIFNALNSSIILVRKKSEKAEDSLLKLASLLRYMLYESDDDKVLLENEVEYISAYIDLQKIRFESSVLISSDIDDFDGDLRWIEPMLLIPFVENAFKHGTGVKDNPEIHISMKDETDSIQLEIKNRFVTKENPQDKNHGIGLVNVKRRLELLYPNSHQLVIRKEDNWYHVLLKINL